MAVLFFLMGKQRWRENRFDVGGVQRWLGMGVKNMGSTLIIKREPLSVLWKK